WEAADILLHLNVKFGLRFSAEESADADTLDRSFKSETLRHSIIGADRRKLMAGSLLHRTQQPFGPQRPSDIEPDAAERCLAGLRCYLIEQDLFVLAEAQFQIAIHPDCFVERVGPGLRLEARQLFFGDADFDLPARFRLDTKLERHRVAFG